MLKSKPISTRIWWLLMTLSSIIIGWFMDDSEWVTEGTYIAQIFTFIFLGAGLLLLTPIRQKVITKPVFKVMKKTLPPISDTEMVALKAGDVWWDKALFSGAPDYDQLSIVDHGLQLSEQEKDYLENKVPELCEMVNGHEVRQAQDLPKKAWNYIKKHKFFGLVIPEEHGGLGFSHTAHSLIVSKLASRSTALGITVMVPNSLGPGELILKYGTESQKTYLRRLAEGREIPCFSLTSTYAGSDAGSIVDSGIVCEREVDGKKVLGFLLNWEKRYITLSPVATLIGLAFKAYDPDHLLPDSHPLKGQVALGITCALITRDTEGVSIGTRHNPLGCGFMNGPNRGKDVFITLDSVIGGADMIGQGWRMLMECLSIGRGISLPSTGNTICQHSLLMAVAYTHTRYQFGLPVAKFEGVGEKLAQMMMRAYRTKANCLLTTKALDQHIVPSIISAIIKYRNTELGRSSINDAMDVHGGRAIISGPSNYLAEAYMAAPFGITVEGANILTRSLMVFGQGVTRCHPYLFDEITALYHDDLNQGVVDFDHTFSQHLSFVFKNIAKLKAVNLLSISPTINYGSKQTQRHYKNLSVASLQFAVVVDVVLLIVGGSLKRREALSGRFADALSCLYEITALTHYFDHSNDKDEKQQLLMHLTVKDLFFQFESVLGAILRNLPLPSFLLSGLHCFVFGWRKKKALADSECMTLAGLSADIDWLKTTLCPDLYISDNEQDAHRLVLDGYNAQRKIQPILDKLKKDKIKYDGRIPFVQFVDDLCQRDIISVEEGELWQAEQVKILKVLRVDEYEGAKIKTAKV